MSFYRTFSCKIHPEWRRGWTFRPETAIKANVTRVDWCICVYVCGCPWMYNVCQDERMLARWYWIALTKKKFFFWSIIPSSEIYERICALLNVFCFCWNENVSAAAFMFVTSQHILLFLHWIFRLDFSFFSFFLFQVNFIDAYCIVMSNFTKIQGDQWIWDTQIFIPLHSIQNILRSDHWLYNLVIRYH